jgi:hypothetical protein
MARRCTTLLLAIALSPPWVPEKLMANDALAPWLATLMRELQSGPVSNPPAFIARYTYRQQLVYYIPPRCCDMPSDLYDAAGALICHPDGGFTGRGDGRCSDFFAERTNEEIVWRDSRGGS